MQYTTPIIFDLSAKLKKNDFQYKFVAYYGKFSLLKKIKNKNKKHCMSKSLASLSTR